jgi:hypothetical protein
MAKYEIKTIGPASVGQIVSIHYALQGGRTGFLDTKGVPCQASPNGLMGIWQIQQSWNPNGSYSCGWAAKGGGAYEALNILLNTEAQPLVGYLKSCTKVEKPKASKATSPKGMVEAPMAGQPLVAATVAAPQPNSEIAELKALVMMMLEERTAPKIEVPAEPVVPQPTAGHQIVMTPKGPMQLVEGQNGRYYLRSTIV